MFSIFNVGSEYLQRKVDFYRSSINSAMTRDLLFDKEEQYLIINSSSGTIHVFEIDPKKVETGFAYINSFFTSVKQAALGTKSIFKFDKVRSSDGYDKLFWVDRGLLLIDHLSNYWKLENLKALLVSEKFKQGKDTITYSSNFFDRSLHLI